MNASEVYSALSMMILRKKFGVVVFSFVLFLSSGCSVFMAANSPTEKNDNLFAIGTSRNQLIAEFGGPISSVYDKETGYKTEIFKFEQGFSKANNVGRAIFHGLADVVTLGLWEIIATPIELIVDGTDMAYEVEFDDLDRVVRVFALKGAETTQAYNYNPEFQGR